jgi:hypothetical protein
VQKLDPEIDFQEKRRFFRQKLAKIAENIARNIGSVSHCHRHTFRTLPKGNSEEAFLWDPL